MWQHNVNIFRKRQDYKWLRYCLCPWLSFFLANFLRLRSNQKKEKQKKLKNEKDRQRQYTEICVQLD